jgi:hypothetical protein
LLSPRADEISEGFLDIVERLSFGRISLGKQRAGRLPPTLVGALRIRKKLSIALQIILSLD